MNKEFSQFNLIPWVLLFDKDAMHQFPDEKNVIVMGILVIFTSATRIISYVLSGIFETEFNQDISSYSLDFPISIQWFQDIYQEPSLVTYGVELLFGFLLMMITVLLFYGLLMDKTDFSFLNVFNIVLVARIPQIFASIAGPVFMIFFNLNFIASFLNAVFLIWTLSLIAVSVEVNSDMSKLDTLIRYIASFLISLILVWFVIRVVHYNIIN